MRGSRLGRGLGSLCVALSLLAAGCATAPRGVSTEALVEAPPSVELVVGIGETWESIADAFFADPGAASRLAQENGADPSRQPEPGDRIVVRIPADQRDRVGRLAEARVPYNAGVELLLAGDRDEEALGEFREAIRQAPEFVDAHYNLGLALLRLQRMDEALEPLVHAAAARPQDKDARYAVASCYFHLSRYAEARTELESALRLDPDFLRARFTYALALERLTEWALAREAWQEYLDRDSTSAWAAEARTHLETIP